MKNAIYYYYGISVEELQENDNIFFVYNDYKYYYLKCNRSVNEINNLVKITNKMLLNNVDSYTFIKTKFNEYYSYYDGNMFVLLRVNSISTDISITLKDILNFNNSYYIDNNSNYDIMSWKILWEGAVDKFELTINELGGEYLVIQESSDYFIGLAENSISFLNNLNEDPKIKLCVTHNRINKNHFYNPLNYLLDYYVRDVAEYFKVCILNYKDIIGELNNLIHSNYLDYNSSVLLFSRLLYPSYYFDAVASILNEELTEDKIDKIIKNIKYYRKILFECNDILNKYFNLPIIYWVKNLD